MIVRFALALIVILFALFSVLATISAVMLSGRHRDWQLEDREQMEYLRQYREKRKEEQKFRNS